MLLRSITENVLHSLCLSPLTRDRCHYISAVQQALASKTQSRERELDRAKQFFEVLHLNPQVGSMQLRGRRKDMARLQMVVSSVCGA